MNDDKTIKLTSDQIATDNCVECAKPCCSGACEVRSNLECTNWLSDIPGEKNDFDIVEVHFKNTRRGFYRNSAHLQLKQGDWVAVEASPGHDIGQVAMMGKLVKLQMKRANLRPDAEILRIFRKARTSDMERFEEAKAREVDTMIRSRKIATDLGLKMKIGDVEYQGDGNKAIFYYIADERVDFRQLIKVLAEVFHIRVEMKQIGARQEAGRIGGIGPCGRPLCCASWMTNFVSVATSAARFQDVSLNPQKLAGQCAKLKCCINFEVDAYVEANKKLPGKDTVLETADKQYYIFKTDSLKQEVTLSTEKNSPVDTVTLPAQQVWEIVALNKSGVKPDRLTLDESEREKEKRAFGDILGQDAINRFDKKKKKRKRSGDHREARGEGERPQQHDAPRRDKRHQPKGDNFKGAQRPDARNANTANANPRQHRSRGERPNRQQRERRNNNRGENRNDNGNKG